ncbi:FAD-dependent oxidoreductase [Dactylosporangium sp. AC04546]|uniref:FAD-dependent oxidoreductase n=1 Tax=Dactylosporangium sp. AC04546 TaxID=2862460 RepID=UPI001EDDACF2|nr:FAD-dependent oxidoreductase [Dactylosporangium sp. AC04546]WVK81729.1 FAD-dependent oxidoreductase [Dactylosporangium sp. AC04546]
MRVVVDLTKCQGYAQCAFLAPAAFQMQGDEALLYDPEPSEEQRDKVRRAAAACPVQAIQIDRLAIQDMPRVATAAANAARIVVVGASLAGLRAAEALREEGFHGSLTMIDNESYEPYDRPPLSKQALSGRVPPDGTALPHRADLDARWRLGVQAIGLELADRRVHLSDGSAVPFDRLLIATGVRARPWPDPTEAALEGMFVLRTRDDALRLQRRLMALPSAFGPPMVNAGPAPDASAHIRGERASAIGGERPGRVLVVGAGFTGSEVASTCRQLGLDVTVAEAGPTPLAGALGGVIGAVAAEIQMEHGVDLRCGTTVLAIEGDAEGRVHRAHFSDGTSQTVDVVVAALGGIRNVEWLRDSGLAVGPWGVACDAGCRAFDVNGLVTDDIFVAGDVARAPNAMFGYQFLALEHWANAVAQAEVAAHNMVSDESDRWPHLHMPQFWSLQFGNNIKSVGVPTFADQVVITQGSVADRRFAAAYGYKGRLTGAVTFNHAKWLPFYERLIEQAAPFPPRFDTVDQPDDMLPVPAAVPDPTFLARDATVVVTGHDPSERHATLLRRTS